VRIGAHLRTLWTHRRWTLAAVLIGIIAAISTIYRIGVLPPSLEPRSLEIGAASTKVLVDTPNSKVIDLRAGTTDFQSLATRANLLANVMASAPVRAQIAERIGVAPDALVAEAPIIANVPRATTEPGSEKRASDLVAQTDQYRLNIQANPQVPVINVYAQAPSASEAQGLADAAVDSLGAYLQSVAAEQRIPDAEQVRLEQLGRARGGVINDGAGIQMAILSFLFVAGLLAIAILAMVRIREGWDAAAPPDAPAPETAPEAHSRPLVADQPHAA
jgi:hypothetical protein